MSATRGDLQTMPFPASWQSINLDRSFSAAEYARIKAGNIPQDMDDKWFAFFEEPWLHLHRSWTGFGIYQVRFESVDDGARVAEIRVNRDPNQYTSSNESSDALLLAVLLDGYAGRETEAAWEKYLESLT